MQNEPHHFAADTCKKTLIPRSSLRSRHWRKKRNFSQSQESCTPADSNPSFFGGPIAENVQKSTVLLSDMHKVGIMDDLTDFVIR